MEFKHVSILFNESIDFLITDKNGIYVDCTMGGAGHSRGFASQLEKDGLLLGIDQDDDAIAAASERLLDKFTCKTAIAKSNFENFADVLDSMGIDQIDGIFFDLGVSSYQLDTPERGFSYMHDGPLDMRMNKDAALDAEYIVNNYKEDELVRIFSEYGEERFSKRIAKKIVETRAKKKIETTKELADLIISATPKIKSAIHPATRVFQAIRIEVNNELKNVNFVLHDILDLLEVGGIISVISFHSLEDRIVKKILKFESQKCRCNEMICKCPPPKIELVNKKPIMASDEEIRENPPSRSAKLRIARCIS